MSSIEYDVFVCTECEANEVLAPVDSTDAKCRVCQDPELDQLMMDNLRVALGLTRK